MSASRKALGQYFTPRWVAEAIVERHFADLRPGAVVIEPSCGDGRFLMALPEHVRAIGVEIDPQWAEAARRNSGREVITGDFLQAPLPSGVDALVGNPPFKADVIGGFLDRAHTLLRDGGKCGLILPAYVMQTSTKVLQMNRRWSMHQELLPRNIFPRLSVPIIFATFTKDQHRRLFGFYLFEEAADVAKLGMRQLLEGGDDAASTAARRGSVWRQAVHKAFDLIDADTAPLSALYQALEARELRPTENRFYKDKVRQVLQSYPEFAPVERGLWQRKTAARRASVQQVTGQQRMEFAS